MFYVCETDEPPYNPYVNQEGNLTIGNVKQYEDTETSDEKMPNSLKAQIASA
jgi:hypothetical protein